MGTSRFLVSATLLLGGCDLLWGAFGEDNPAFCDPATPGCTPAMNADGGEGGEGGIDMSVADGAGEDTDAATGTIDASAVVDAAVGDSAQSPDLLCEPSTSLWLTDPDVPTITVNLTGVTGNGAGDLWIVGNPTFAAHYKTSWNTISVSSLSVPSFGRAVYSPKLGQVLALGSTLLNSGVAHLTTTALGTVDAFGLLSGVPSGIWISAAPESQPYLVSIGLDAAIKFYNGSSWQDVASSAPPFTLSGLAGSGTGAATTIWGAATTNNPVVSFTSATKWKSATSTAGSFNAVWVSPISGVVVVGKNGVIMNTPATQTVNPLMSMGSPVSTTLTDVAGTVDGSHLWAVGSGGTIVHWDSGCRKWVREANTNTKDLNALWVDDARKTVWAVGAGGVVHYRTFP